MERKMLLGTKQRAEKLATTGREHGRNCAPGLTRGGGHELRVLVAYASRFGSTGGVAERIAGKLRGRESRRRPTG